MVEDSGANDARQAVFEQIARTEELELGIEKLVAGGDGLGRFRGFPIFVSRSAPGDRLRIKLVERRSQYARGEILEVLEAGAGRRQPPCRHFSDCGGCDLQHLDDELQTKLKVEAARETLLRLGGLELPEDQRTISAEAWGYRLRAQLHLEAEARPRIGYFERGSHRLVEIEECPILMPPLERFVSSLADQLTGEMPRRLDVALGDGERLTCAPALAELPRGEVSVDLASGRYVFDARTFFQGHRFLLDELVAEVVGPYSGEQAWDLYAGVGLFSLTLATRYKKVTAIEGDRVSVRYLRKNARLAKASAIEAITSPVESGVKRMPQEADRVVVDPPRAGLGFRVRAELFDRRPRRLTYVSCHPAVLARDLKHLCRVYEIEKLAFFDLFPQTGHIETVVQLRVPESAAR